MAECAEHPTTKATAIAKRITGAPIES
jgi:hypothetical protein